MSTMTNSRIGVRDWYRFAGHTTPSVLGGSG